IPPQFRLETSIGRISLAIKQSGAGGPTQALPGSLTALGLECEHIVIRGFKTLHETTTEFEMASFFLQERMSDFASPQEAVLWCRSTSAEVPALKGRYTIQVVETTPSVLAFELPRHVIAQISATQFMEMSLLLIDFYDSIASAYRGNM